MDLMKNLSQSKNIKNYCKKCLSLLDNNVVRDSDGREFCSSFCRSEYHAEMRKEMICRYDEWRGVDEN